ncbi:unnamed protein product [Ectocarpus sp. CCAP 1310/34]|nr:unnamed protein product [Ectocarpus sp. CCAP 1310/34]
MSGQEKELVDFEHEKDQQQDQGPQRSSGGSGSSSEDVEDESRIWRRPRFRLARVQALLQDASSEDLSAAFRDGDITLRDIVSTCLSSDVPRPVPPFDLDMSHEEISRLPPDDYDALLQLSEHWHGRLTENLRAEAEAVAEKAAAEEAAAAAAARAEAERVAPEQAAAKQAAAKEADAAATAAAVEEKAAAEQAQFEERLRQGHRQSADIAFLHRSVGMPSRDVTFHHQDQSDADTAWGACRQVVLDAVRPTPISQVTFGTLFNKGFIKKLTPFQQQNVFRLAHALRRATFRDEPQGSILVTPSGGLQPPLNRAASTTDQRDITSSNYGKATQRDSSHFSRGSGEGRNHSEFTAPASSTSDEDSTSHKSASGCGSGDGLHPYVAAEGEEAGAPLGAGPTGLRQRVVAAGAGAGARIGAGLTGSSTGARVWKDALDAADGAAAEADIIHIQDKMDKLKPEQLDGVNRLPLGPDPDEFARFASSCQLVVAEILTKTDVKRQHNFHFTTWVSGWLPLLRKRVRATVVEGQPSNRTTMEFLNDIFQQVEAHLRKDPAGPSTHTCFIQKLAGAWGFQDKSSGD